MVMVTVMYIYSQEDRYGWRTAHQMCAVYNIRTYNIISICSISVLFIDKYTTRRLLSKSVAI